MLQRLPIRRRHLGITVAVVGILVVVVGLVFLVIVLPPAVIRASRPDIGKASAADQLKAENDLRSTLVTMLAGVAVATGTGVAALNFINARAALAETQRQNRESSDLQHRGQVNERFGKAVEQLGELTKLDVRLGGIYALEQIAKDSEDLHWPTVEVLTAFIREHTKPDAGGQMKGEQPEHDQGSPANRKVATDIQAALTVLRRRNSDTDRGRVDLRGANLQTANLFNANLQVANLGEANLQGADLGGANLQDAKLGEANLQGANLLLANLQGAKLGEADLQGADLRGARLQTAYLVEANLQAANLGGASLQSAYLRGADLQGARLIQANLQGADLGRANLQGADLGRANLEGADLGEADLRGVDLSHTVGLTREQLDGAFYDEGTVPRALTIKVKSAKAEESLSHPEE